MSPLSKPLSPIISLRQLTLDELWTEAETLGLIRVWTMSDFKDTKPTGYKVTLIGHRRNTKLEIERQHTSLACALGDAINEAREMGLGEQE